MTTIVTRAGKGAALTWAEGDANFTNLNSAKAELTDLASTADLTKGVTLVGGAQRTVSSIANLRLLPKTGIPQALVTGYYAPGDGGGGSYYYDPTDTTSADNGGTIIVASDSGRWKLTNTTTINVKQFGAKVDGATDDSAAYLAALTAVLMVTIPSGTMIIGSVAVPAGRTVIGAGRNATTIKIKNGSNTDGHTIVNANDIEFSNLTIDGNSANNSAGSGIYVSGTSARVYLRNVRLTNCKNAGIAGGTGTSYIEAHACRIDSNGQDGFQMTGVDSPCLFMCTVTGNGRYGAVYGSSCTNVREGLNQFKSNTQGGSVMVGGSDAIRLGNIADENGTGHGFQYNGVTRGSYIGNIAKGNGISGLDFTLASSYGAALGNISYGNTVRGIEIDSGSLYNSCIGNIVYRNAETGISVYRSPTALLLGNLASENGTGGTNKFGIRLWDDLNTSPSNNCRLIGNNATDDRGGSATQAYGISIEAASTVGTVVDGNNLGSYLTGPISFVAGSIQYMRDNNGYITQTTGAATIASGTTSVVVNHGLSGTPSYGSITFTASNSGTNDPGQMWVSGITSTQFTLNCRNNPGVGGVTFVWKANLY